MYWHTVGVVNRRRVSGTFPNGEHGSEERPASGVAIQWGRHNLILTAKHALDDALPDDIRIFCRPRGDLEIQLSVTPLPLLQNDNSDCQARIYRCGWEDIAVLTQPPFEGMNLEPFHLHGNWAEPNTGDKLIGYGFPTADCFKVAEVQHSPEMRSFARAVPPAHWESSVIRPVPFREFDESHYYVIRWDPDTMGQPHGYSGSAAWRIPEHAGGIWFPRLQFCGILTHFDREKKAERVVKASAIVKYLSDTFGAVQN